MRSPSLLAAALAAAALLTACSGAPSQQAQSSQKCDDFARSGGYPYLTGGRVYGPNRNIEQLPGSPPLIFGLFDGATQRHLEEEQYLSDWCMKNL